MRIVNINISINIIQIDFAKGIKDTTILYKDENMNDDKIIKLGEKTIENLLEPVKDLVLMLFGLGFKEIGDLFGDTVRSYRIRKAVDTMIKTKNLFEKKV